MMYRQGRQTHCSGRHHENESHKMMSQTSHTKQSHKSITQINHTTESHETGHEWDDITYKKRKSQLPEIHGNMINGNGKLHMKTYQLTGKFRE